MKLLHRALLALSLSLAAAPAFAQTVYDNSGAPAVDVTATRRYDGAAVTVQAPGFFTMNPATGLPNVGTGAATGGTAPTAATEMGCVYRSPQTTVTTGQLAGVQCDNKGNLYSVGAFPTNVVAFRQTCTTSAVQMASNPLSNGVVIKALAANSGTAYIGPAGVTTATGYPLAVGEAISYGVANSNQLYLICSGAVDTIAVTGN